MSLIECPECGRGVSSSAASCPACGYPIAAALTPPRGPEPAAARWRARVKLGAHIAARVIIGTIIFGVGVDGSAGDAAGAAAVGGLLIGVSAIPVWYRARLGRAQSGSLPRFEERLAELERRHREQMAEFARLQSEQVADLEERVDFAERLLTKRREELDA